MIFIADTHLGRGDRADDFGGMNGTKARYLLRLTDYCEAVNEKLTIVGDFADLHQCKWHEVCEEYAGLLSAIKDVLFAYIAGNHDRELTGKTIMGVKVVPNLIWKKVFIDHGDYHDWFIARYPEAARRITDVAGWAERIIHPDADLWAENLWKWITRTGRHGSNEKYWMPVWKRADIRMKCRWAVFGHTHEWGIWPMENRAAVYNPGGWPGKFDPTKKYWVRIPDNAAQKGNQCTVNLTVRIPG